MSPRQCWPSGANEAPDNLAGYPLTCAFFIHAQYSTPTYRRIGRSARSKPLEQHGTRRFIDSDYQHRTGKGDLMTEYRGAMAGQWPIRRVADLLPHADSRADWGPVRTLFQQLIRLVDSGSQRIPEEVAEALSDAVDKISASYAGREAELCEHTLAILADAEGLELLDLGAYRKYYEDERSNPAPWLKDGVRRLPALYEAVVETCRRLRDAKALRAACRDTDTSGLLIGSVNYGRFYNIRGNRHGDTASDLDFIIVIEQAKALDGIAAALAALPGVATSDVERFVRRARMFVGSLDHRWTVFSHKITLWSEGTPDPMLPSGVARAEYLLSLHVMTRPVLDYALVTSTPQLLKERAGGRRTLKDYRETSTVRWDDLNDFSGRRHRVALDAQPVQDGWLRSPLVYYIDELNCYFPGFYQTMLFPQPDLLWDDLDVRPAVNEFQRKLGERVRFEKSQRGNTLLRLSFAHVRRDVFTPRVVRLLDAGYSCS
jgi:hypothetical protein